MNRFDHTSPKMNRAFFRWAPIVIFLVILGIFLSGIQSVQGTTESKQKESLETALTRSITQCYAVEGIYPPDLQYLIDHYGLTYDSNTFLIDYDCYGSNLMPEFTVMRKSGK